MVSKLKTKQKKVYEKFLLNNNEIDIKEINDCLNEKSQKVKVSDTEKSPKPA